MNITTLAYSTPLCLIANALAAPSLPPYLSVGGEYTHELTGVLDGGINQRSSHRELLVLEAELDLEKFLGIKNATLFAQFQHATTEKGGASDTGDIQGYTNLEVESSIDEIYEFCPDVIDQNFGCMDEMIETMKETGRDLPPHIAELIDGVNFEDDGFGKTLLEKSLRTSKSLGLWWD